MPFVSEAQRRLMYAAAAGKKTKADISQKAAKKMVTEDEPGKLPEKIDKSNGMMSSITSSPSVSSQPSASRMNPSPGFQGSSADTAMMKAENDGSDMAKQLLAQINEMSEKINGIINSDQELEDWVDSKIVSAKKDLEDIASYLMHNKDIEKSIHGGSSTPEKTVAVVDGIAKTEEPRKPLQPDPMVLGQNKMVFEAAHKDFVKKHGSTILALGRGEKIKPAAAAEYNKDRGNLPVYFGINQRDIPQKILTHHIDQGEPKTFNYAEMNKKPLLKPKSAARNNVIDAEIVAPPALPPAKKSMEDLANPKSLLQKMDDCTKCMRKNSGEDLEKSSKKKSKPFHGYNKKKHARSGGLNDSYRKKVNRETGSNLKRPVTKKNVKPGSKAAKRRKSFCARMSGVKGPTSKKGKLTPKGAALKRWRCSKSLTKSESAPLELRAQKVLKSLNNLINKSTGVARKKSDALREEKVNQIKAQIESGEYNPTEKIADKLADEIVHKKKELDKSNTVKPFGENIYDEVKNIGRKMKRTGEVREGAGKNVAVQQTKPTASQQAAMIAEKDEKKNKEQPVALFTLKDVPPEHRQAVLDARLKGESHPLMHLAVKIKPNSRKKAVTPKELLPPKQKKSGKKGDKQPVILTEEDLKASYSTKNHLSKAHEVLSKLEKKFSLKGALAAGALGAGALSGIAQASPESDLHSQLSNLNVMGEYHTPKSGSMAVLKEPSQLKADPTHPSASYSREAGSSSSMGSFHGPDAEKAKQLLQNYDAASSKPFAKNDKLEGGKGDSKKVADFDPPEVTSGKKVEMEHTKDPAIAQEITKDHLSEDPKYYSKLKAAGLADELKKAHEVLSKLEKRCWEGYKPVPGKKPYSKGSCEPVGKSEDKTKISAQAMESGEYQGEKLDAYHHNRLGNEYKELARRAYLSGDKGGALKMTDKSNYHFSMATKKGYSSPE